MGKANRMPVVIRLLGAFQVITGDNVAIDATWRPAKAAAIIKILALQRGRTLHRDQLIDLLWPDADAEAGASSFYKNIHFLRAALRAAGHEDLLALNRSAVTLSAGAALDIDAFRDAAMRALATADVVALEQALVACTGDLLPDDLYEPWTEPHRDELRVLRQRLLLEVAARYLRRGRIDDAVHRYHEVLAADPLAEDAHRGLIRAYGARGERELALHQYERCTALLAEHLGTAPSPETEALIAEVRRVPRLRDAVDEAVSPHVGQGDAAMRRRAWSEAVAHYRDAIEALRAVDQDDEREAALLLKLAKATVAVSADPVIAEYCRRAAQLAERAGAFDLMADALVQFQDATDALPGNHAGHREAAELIDAALARCPEGPSASRALLLAAGARPAAAAEQPDNQRHITGRLSVAGRRDDAIEQRLREAVAVARQAGHPGVLAYALSRLRVYITSPDTLDERLELTREMLALNMQMHQPVKEFEALLFHHEDLLEAGDIDGARIQARAMRRLGESMRSNGMLVVAGSLLATHATADGEFALAKRLLFGSRDLDAERGDNANSQYRFGIQLLMLRWHEGRIGEMYGAYRRAVDVLPQVGGSRAALALICAETGRDEEAREHLDTLAAQPVAAIAKDYMWWLTTVCMALVAIATGADAIARDLYGLLLPNAGRNASAVGAASFGSASLVLARLAAHLGDHAAAERHYEDALAANVRTRQRVWAARTRAHYARFLLDRGNARGRDHARIALADARELGMPALAAELTAPPFA
jgi:DNA-binding SARP family transcriptional activator